jgi:hypothetical protein
MPAAAVTVPAAFSAPAPVPGIFGFAGVTPNSSDRVIWAAVSHGYRERDSAATPAVSAAPMSVVDSVVYPPSGAATVRPTPGAVSVT